MDDSYVLITLANSLVAIFVATNLLAPGMSLTIKESASLRVIAAYRARTAGPIRRGEDE